jgi:hypothetical protein
MYDPAAIMENPPRGIKSEINCGKLLNLELLCSLVAGADEIKSAMRAFPIVRFCREPVFEDSVNGLIVMGESGSNATRGQRNWFELAG